jgi:glycosyltransferase involved in cell wall biosynthesis
MKKTLIIIPVFNGGPQLGKLIGKIREFTDCAILAVDDGSTDDTPALLRGAGVEVLRHGKNRGKGAALASGFVWAIDKGYEFALTMDGDGQHDPSDLSGFFKYDADVVLGARSFKRGLMPPARILSNTLTSKLLSLVTGKEIKDSQCGYRKIRMAFLPSFRPRLTGFQYETEILLHILKRKRGSVINVPVATIYSGEKSYIRHFRDTLQFIAVVWRYLWISG